MFKFLQSTAARVATVFLLIQTAVLYSSIRPEYVPKTPPLNDLPLQLGAWRMTQQGYVDKETEDVLKADATLSRDYSNSSTGAAADLWIAAFQTQRNGKAPHSPKNCLPGNGWTQLSSSDYAIDVGLASPIVVNRYVIVHGDQRELVLYWYQSRDRVVADEFKAKFWVVVDAIRLNRTDTALVRVITDITDNDQEQATRNAVQFVQALFGALRQYLPS